MKKNRRILLMLFITTAIMAIVQVMNVLVSETRDIGNGIGYTIISSVFDSQTIEENHLYVLAFTSVGLTVIQNILLATFISSYVNMNNVYYYIRIKKIKSFIIKRALQLLVYILLDTIIYVVIIAMVWMLKTTYIVNFDLYKAIFCLIYSFTYWGYLTTLLINLLTIVKSETIGFLITYCVEIFLWWLGVSGMFLNIPWLNFMNPVKIMSIYYLKSTIDIVIQLILNGLIVVAFIGISCWMAQRKQIGLSKG